MRFLSSSEFEQIETKSNIPVDLSSHYLPALFSIDSRISSHSDISKHRAAELLLEVEKTLHCSSLIYPNERSYADRCESFTWTEDHPEGGEIAYTRMSTVTMLPAASILHHKDLLERGITPEPGFLYLQCRIPDAHAQISTLYGDEVRPNRSCSYSSSDFVHLTRKALSELEDETVKKADESVAAEKKREREEYGLYLIGKIGDVAAVTNSLIIACEEAPYSATVRSLARERIENARDEHEKRCAERDSRNFEKIEADYILKTPFSFPAGFVRETASVLEKEWGPKSPAVKRFKESALEPHKVPEEYRLDQPTNLIAGKFNSDYPVPPPKPMGPDSWWRGSEDPFWVQTILLARLIGGNFWQYALGILEQKIGKSLVE